MATYLIRDNIAHFYSAEDIDFQYPDTRTVHVKHWLDLLKTYCVIEVVDVPFKLNKYFKISKESIS